MSLPELIARFVRPLTQLDVTYMVVGGVAAIIYSEPRYTQDVDLVVRLEPKHAADFAAALPGNEFYVPPLEVIEAEARRPAFGHCNLSHHDTGLRPDIYLSGKDPVQDWGLTRRHKIVLRGEPVWLAPVEYVILAKLKFYREGGSARHLEDIAAILRISSDRIDYRELETQISQQLLGPEWEKARQS